MTEKYFHCATKQLKLEIYDGNSIFLFSSDFSPALLLLVFISPLWQVSQPLPVTTKGPMTDHCVLYARILLQNITYTLSQVGLQHQTITVIFNLCRSFIGYWKFVLLCPQNQLFTGINCTKQSVELNMETNTPSVCAPKVNNESSHSHTYGYFKFQTWQITLK